MSRRNLACDAARGLTLILVLLGVPADPALYAGIGLAAFWWAVYAIWRAIDEFETRRALTEFDEDLLRRSRNEDDGEDGDDADGENDDGAAELARGT